MTLGEYISIYMNSHGLSQRQFAVQCNLSNGYISILINGVSPKTGEPVKPTIDSYIKLADGMGIPLNQLLRSIDDAPVSLLPPSEDIDNDLWQMREEMRRNPELRTLYDLQRSATKKELKQMEAFIRAIRSSNDHEDTD